MTTFVVNADDFGLRPEVNHRILDAFRAGLLTRASLLANLPAASGALALARAHPGLAVGVHLNLTAGRPLAPSRRVPSLIGADGGFHPGPAAFARRFLAGRVREQEVRLEWQAQIESLVDAGIRPSHVDGHHHIHFLPGLARTACELARRFGIPRIRLPARISWAAARESPAHAVEHRLLGVLARRARVHLRGLESCETFLELPPGLQDGGAYLRILRRLRCGSGRARANGCHRGDGHAGADLTEIACHPGYAGRHPGASAPPGPDPELQALANPLLRGGLRSIVMSGPLGEAEPRRRSHHDD